MNSPAIGIITLVLCGTLLNFGCGEPEAQPISTAQPDPNGPIILFDSSRDQTERSVNETQNSSGGTKAARP